MVLAALSFDSDSKLSVFVVRSNAIPFKSDQISISIGLGQPSGFLTFLQSGSIVPIVSTVACLSFSIHRSDSAPNGLKMEASDPAVMFDLLCQKLAQNSLVEVKLPELNHKNWPLWKKRMRLSLRQHFLLSCIENKPPPTSERSSSERKRDMAAMVMITNQLPEQLLDQTDTLDSAYEVWRMLIDCYEGDTWNRMTSLFNQLFALKYSSNDLFEFNEEYGRIADQLVKMRVSIDDFCRYNFIRDLPDHLDQFKPCLHVMSNASLKDLAASAEKYDEMFDRMQANQESPTIHSSEQVKPSVSASVSNQSPPSVSVSNQSPPSVSVPNQCPPSAASSGSNQCPPSIDSSVLIQGKSTLAAFSPTELASKLTAESPSFVPPNFNEGSAMPIPWYLKKNQFKGPKNGYFKPSIRHQYQ
jgi:hypothetical protein